MPAVTPARFTTAEDAALLAAARAHLGVPAGAPIADVRAAWEAAPALNDRRRLAAALRAALPAAAQTRPATRAAASREYNRLTLLLRGGGRHTHETVGPGERLVALAVATEGLPAAALGPAARGFGRSPWSLSPLKCGVGGRADRAHDPWNPEDDARLLLLAHHRCCPDCLLGPLARCARSLRPPHTFPFWRLISEDLGRSPSACLARFNRIKASDPSFQ